MDAIWKEGEPTLRQELWNEIGYDINTVICYHGGVYQDNVNQRLLELAKE